MRRAFAMAAVLTLAGRAAAEPRLPAGWTAGALAPDPEPYATSSRRALLDAHIRPEVAPERLPIAAIPRMDMTPEPPWTRDARAPAPGPVAEDVIVGAGCSVAKVRGRRLGTISAGWATEWFTGDDGGVSLWHVRPDIVRWKPAEWQSLDAGPDGRAVYRLARGWFDVQACRFHVTERFEVAPLRVADGAAYVLRTRCEACVPGKQEALRVLVPDGLVGLAERVLPLDAGTSGARELRLTPWSFHFLRGAGLTVDRERETVVHVDASRGVSDPEPLVTISATDAM